MREASHPAVAEAVSLRSDRRLVLRALAAAGRDAAHTSDLAAELDAIESRLRSLLDDPESGAFLTAALDERAKVLRIAVAARHDAAAGSEAGRRAAAMRRRAVEDGRELTPVEQDRVTRLTRLAAEHALPRPGDGWSHRIDDRARRDAVLEALATLALREARTQLRDGLLITEQMRGIIDEAVPALLGGSPVLLVGETGGAKTALAEHLARHGIGREPELVSGYGDITSAQLIGTHELRAEGGATVSAFVPGPLHRAMTHGHPVILDEVNAMPPEFLKRLNRILQLRPGDRLGIQENGGREIRIAPGFAIIATANEQTPHRYRGLDRLSAELVNRFGANAYRVHYPDSGRSYDEFPTENARLATAAVVDGNGRLPAALSADEIARVARAAFISQQVFAGAHGEGFTDYVSTERGIDGRPGLEESVLAPRTLVAILQKVASARGALTLDRALTRFVEGVMHAEDRRVLAHIIAGQGFRLG